MSASTTRGVLPAQQSCRVVHTDLSKSDALWSISDACVRCTRFKDTYDSLPKPVMKADACRVLYMHKYGGARWSRSTVCTSDPCLGRFLIIESRLTLEESGLLSCSRGLLQDIAGA